jgi:hypothetical protein
MTSLISKALAISGVFLAAFSSGINSLRFFVLSGDPPAFTSIFWFTLLGLALYLFGIYSLNKLNIKLRPWFIIPLIILSFSTILPLVNEQLKWSSGGANATIGTIVAFILIFGGTITVIWSFVEAARIAATRAK